MRKEEFVFIFIFAFILFGANVSATGVSVEDVSSTLKRVTISGASSLYAYEVNFSVNSGSIGSVVSANFLGPTSEATYGSSESGGYLFVYGSRLDPGRSGKSGSGDLFNITFTTLDLTLKGLMAIDTSGEEEHVTYNALTGGTTGGGGTTSGTVPPIETEKNIDLIVVPSEIIIDIISGEKEKKEIVIRNVGDRVTLNIVLNQLEEVIKFRERSFALGSGEERTLVFDVTGPNRGLIVGTIEFQEGETAHAKIPVIINTRSENFLFDAKVAVPFGFKKLNIGENLIVDVVLVQVGPREKVDVAANYIIKDFNGNTLLEESETFFVLGEKTLSKELITSALEPGKYVVGLEIVYPGAFAVSSTQFEVAERSPPIDINIIIIAAAIIVITAVLAVVIWAVRRSPSAKKKK